MRVDESGRTHGNSPKAVVGNTALAVEKVWAEVASLLRRIATKTTEDRDLRDDMVQEAHIFLWEIDPTRFDLRNRVERDYLVGMLINRMREVRYRHESRPV